jgi:hypothetical protein
VVSFTPRPVNPWERAPVPIGTDAGWASAGLDAVEKRKILPLPGIEPGPSRLQLVSIPTELP